MASPLERQCISSYGGSACQTTRTLDHLAAMGSKGERSNAPRDPKRDEVDAALRRVRAALLQDGLLLLQDAELPAQPR